MPSWPWTPALSVPLPISALVSAITPPLSVSRLSFHDPSSLALPPCPSQTSPFLQTFAPGHTAFPRAGLGFPWQVRTEMPAAQLKSSSPQAGLWVSVEGTVVCTVSKECRQVNRASCLLNSSPFAQAALCSIGLGWINKSLFPAQPPLELGLTSPALSWPTCPLS